MNYERRYSPPGPGGNDQSSRSGPPRSQGTTPRGGIDSRAQYYGREYPPLRSRSQTHMDQDYGDRYAPQPQFYDGRVLDRTSRSKSLDAREFRGEDDYYRDDYQSGGVVIPIRRETGRARPFESRSSPRSRPRPEFEYPPIDDRRGNDGGEIHIPYNRDAPPQQQFRDPFPPREFGPPRRSFDDRPKFGDSPKSYSSRYQAGGERRAIEYGGERERERGGYFDDYDREEFSGPVQPYRGGGGGGGVATGGASSGYRSSNFHRSHHESHGGHETSFGGPGGVGQRGAIVQQPHGYHPDGRPIRPIQHHRVQCCCFKFVWPPWSYEQAPPPQPIYRNI